MQWGPRGPWGGLRARGRSGVVGVVRKQAQWRSRGWASGDGGDGGGGGSGGGVAGQEEGTSWQGRAGQGRPVVRPCARFEKAE